MELTLTQWVVGVLSLSMGLVLLFWWIGRSRTRAAERVSLRRRVVCRLCLHAFEVSGGPDPVDCPICGARNERGRPRRLG